jgi:ribosomal-protein-alanine N-acetyltransferase
MIGVIVRVANVADLADVIRLERCTPEAPHWAEVEYTRILDQRNEHNAVRRCFLVALADECLVGFAVSRATGEGDEGFAELETIVVDRVWRRKGVGRVLCDAVIAWCRELGLGRLELEVRAGSAGAVALYRTLKFVVVGSRPRYYLNPEEDALLMRLQLELRECDTVGL